MSFWVVDSSAAIDISWELYEGERFVEFSDGSSFGKSRLSDDLSHERKTKMQRRLGSKAKNLQK
jgi:hypothetical protein